MNEEELARVLRRDPNINVPRPVYKRPELTQPLKWKSRSAHYKASKFPAQPRTQPRQWLAQEYLKTPWLELIRLKKPVPPPRPARPLPPPAPTGTGDSEEELLPLEAEREHAESPEARKRNRSPDEEDSDGHEKTPVKRQKRESQSGRKIDRGKGIERSQVPKAIRPPAHAPGILPLSPQDARAPRIANPEIAPLRNRFPGPGNFEHKWKDNPKADENRKIRDGIPKNFQDVPDVRLMPERVSKNKKRVKNFKYMGDQEFYDMEVPDSGDCFFGAVSMALYGTVMYWHWVKFCHLDFFRFVLTHPGHPRYDSYWRLNSNISSQSKRNIWQQLTTPHAWQSSDLLNVTADIFNLFIVLCEQLDIPKDIPKSQQKPQDYQSIGLYGQYSATHIFLHIINRNHYQTLVPYNNPEAQFPFPDGVKINPKPGRAKERPPGGRGRAIIPPPIAQPVYVGPWDLDIARVLGINTKDGALDIDLMNTWMRRERQAAERKNDPTEVKWWIQAKEREAEEEKAREAKAVEGLSKGAEVKKARPSNETLAKGLDKTLGKGEKDVQLMNEELEKDLETTLRKWKERGQRRSYESFTKDLERSLGKWKGKGLKPSYDHFVNVLRRTLDRDESVQASSDGVAKALEHMVVKWKKNGVRFSYVEFINGLKERLEEGKNESLGKTLGSGRGAPQSNEKLSQDLGKSLDERRPRDSKPEPLGPRPPATRDSARKTSVSSIIDLLSSSDEEAEEIKPPPPTHPGTFVKSSKRSCSDSSVEDFQSRRVTRAPVNPSTTTEVPPKTAKKVIDLLSSSDEEVKEVKPGPVTRAPVNPSTTAGSGSGSKTAPSNVIDLLSSSDDDVVEFRRQDAPAPRRRPPGRQAPAARRGGRPPPRW